MAYKVNFVYSSSRLRWRPQNEDDLKNEDNQKNEDDLKNENDLSKMMTTSIVKIVKDHTTLHYTAIGGIFILFPSALLFMVGD